MIISEHAIDTHLYDREWRRKLGHYINYRSRGEWCTAGKVVNGSLGEVSVGAGLREMPIVGDTAHPTLPAKEFADSAAFCALERAGQVLCGKAEDAEVSHTVSLSNRPECWVTFTALATERPIVERRADGSLFHCGAWRDVDLSQELRAAGIEEILTINRRDLLTFSWSFEHADGMSWSFDGAALRFFDRDGVEVIRQSPPWARDSATVALLGWQPMMVKVYEGDRTRDGLPTIVYALDKEEMAKAILPVRLGPTTTISGLVNVEDAFIKSEGINTEDRNCGGSPYLCVGKYNGSTGKRRQLWRCAASAIPAGTITDFRLKALRLSSALETQAGSVLSYIIANENAWVEGTQNEGSGADASCWDYAKTSSIPWHGSEGCGTSSEDYDAAPEQSTAFAAYTSGSDVWFTFTLATAWATAWRDATRTNNGILQKVSGEDTSGCFWFGYSTENGTEGKRPYFEVDYTATSPQVYQSTYSRRRK